MFLAVAQTLDDQAELSYAGTGVGGGDVTSTTTKSTL